MIPFVLAPDGDQPEIVIYTDNGHVIIGIGNIIEAVCTPNEACHIAQAIMYTAQKTGQDT